MRVAIIPARGGSVRIPRKNIRWFVDGAMIGHPLETAKASGLFDLIVVSTDDMDIAGYSFAHGATVVPREADDGTTGTQEIAARVLDQLDLAGECCVIYPCSPLLDAHHLALGRSYLLRPEAKCFARSVGPDGEDAGCFYWGWTRAFRDRKPLDAFNTIDVPMPAERVQDINTEADWLAAEAKFIALRRAI